MIDIENIVYTKIHDALQGIDVAGDYVEQPSVFPHVSVQEISNIVRSANMDTSKIEQYASLLYSIDVYSAKTVGKKSEAKSIAEQVNTVMEGLGFRRSMCQPMPNVDRTIYRITMRYSGTVHEYVNGDNITYLVRPI